MGKILGRIVLLGLSSVGIILLAYFGLLALAVEKQDYLWSEMDWNKDGKTTIVEYFMSSDIGKRNTTVDGNECIEYYAYKDGLPVTLICS